MFRSIGTLVAALGLAVSAVAASAALWSGGSPGSGTNCRGICPDGCCPCGPECAEPCRVNCRPPADDPCGGMCPPNCCAESTKTE